MKRRMALGALCMVMAVAAFALSGCPALGIGRYSNLGKIVVHNDGTGEHNERITRLSAVRVADECSDQKPEGVNLLPEPILIRQSFTIEDLPEGRHFCETVVRYFNTREQIESDYTSRGFVTVAAGGTANWYVQ